MTFTDCRCGLLHGLPDRGSIEKTQRLRIALAVLGSFFAIELAIGYWSQSLALLADAGHMLIDMAAIAVTVGASWLAQRPAVGRATFGHQRAEVLAALLNGISLVAIALVVAGEAIDRLQSPTPVLALPMLIGATLGLIVNSINIALLHPGHDRDLNLHGALLHVIADAASAGGAILAAIGLYYCGWVWADAAASLLIACFTLLSALPLLKHSLEVLMEYAPATVDPIAVRAAIATVDAVEQIQMLHIWTVNSAQVILCARLTVKTLNLEESDRLLQTLRSLLDQEFGVTESILELEQILAVQVPLHPLLTESLTAMFARKHESQSRQ